jgi:hypothetical protein
MNKVFEIFEVVEFDLADDKIESDGLAFINADDYTYSSEKKAEYQIEKYLEFGDRDKKYIVKAVYSR